MKRILPYLLAVFLIVPLAAFKVHNGQSASESKQTIFQHLQQEGHLQMTLETDFKQLYKNKFTNDYQPAKLVVHQKNGTSESWEIELRPRGKMRRKVCEIPPVKIRFSENDLEAKGLNKRRTLKMVLICRNSSGFEQLLLREYLAYRFYNMLTENSYRVQLIKIKYADSDGGKAPIESFAFIIEHPKDLADRLETVVLEDRKLRSATMKTDESELFTMFQYMIGNTDWHFYNGHNVDMVGKTGTAHVIPIPYDFDYSGLVKAPYAVPHDMLKLQHVTERYYQGYCMDREATEKTIQIFLEKKDSIMKLATEFPFSKKYSQKFMCKYLGDFFKIIENPKSRKRLIYEHCDLWPVP